MLCLASLNCWTGLKETGSRLLLPIQDFPWDAKKGKSWKRQDSCSSISMRVSLVIILGVEKGLSALACPLFLTMRIPTY